MSWSDNPFFKRSVRTLRHGDWSEGGDALWQWRGLLAGMASNRGAMLSVAIERYADKLNFQVPWFEDDESLGLALTGLRPRDDSGQIMDLLSRHPQVLEWARKGGGDLFSQSHPLWVAISHACLPMLSRFLDLDDAFIRWKCFTHPQFKNEKEDTPLAFCIRRGWVEGVKFLMERGIRTFDSPLAIAATRSQKALCEMFIEQGFPVDHRNAEGKTILGRMARGLKNLKFMSGSELSLSQEQAILEVAALIIRHGGRLDVHDGHSRRALTVEALWNKEGGVEMVGKIKAIAEQSRLQKALADTLENDTLEEVRARPRL